MMFPELTYNSMWIYIMAPALGGVLSGFFILLKMKYNKTEKEEKLEVARASDEIEFSSIDT